MKLKKAIEILNSNCQTHHVRTDPDFLDAIKLGIEALKVVLKIRHYPFPEEILRLPGETPGKETG